MDIPFSLRGADGRIVVDLAVNDDPIAVGCDYLLFGEPIDLARDYPVCTAVIKYEALGYSAVFGWTQLVCSTDNSSGGQSFETDPIAVYRNVATPFAWYGVKPTLFDAPFRFSRQDVTWLCHSFLCFLPDAVLSPRVRALAGFSWGFETAGEQVTIRDVAVLPATSWNDNLLVLSNAYPEWTFDEDYQTA